MSLHCVSKEALAEKVREHSLYSIYEINSNTFSIAYKMKRGHARHGRPRRTFLKPAKDKNRKLCTRWYQIVLSEGNFVLCSRLFLYRLSYCLNSTILNIPKLFSSLYRANCYELSKNENKNRIRVTLQTGVPFSSFPYFKNANFEVLLL